FRFEPNTHRAGTITVGPCEVGFAEPGLVKSCQAAVERHYVVDVIAAHQGIIGTKLELRIQHLQSGSVEYRAAPRTDTRGEARVKRPRGLHSCQQHRGGESVSRRRTAQAVHRTEAEPLHRNHSPELRPRRSTLACASFRWQVHAWNTP